MILLGHLEGDLVLARVGRLLEQKCRQSNVVARYGGDEFVILMPETGVEQAQVLAERLRVWIATDPMIAEHQITGSFERGQLPGSRLFGRRHHPRRRCRHVRVEARGRQSRVYCRGV